MEKALKLKGCLIMMLFLLMGTGIFAQTSEQQVKTVFIFNFTRYIQWPLSEGDFTIGILGNDEKIFNSFLNMAAKKSSASKRIVVKSFTSINEARDCDILFIPKSNSSELAQVKSQSLQNILIITEKPGLAQKGSSINFIHIDGKIRFEINKSEVEKNGLKISSQLLGLGIEV